MATAIGSRPARQFIPLIEGTYLSGMLTYWVFETVASELGDWLRVHQHASIGVNVPPEILGRGGLQYLATEAGRIRNQEPDHPRGHGARRP